MVLGNAVNLKKKARIKIKDACVLIGVIDEDGILNEGEIFLRYEISNYEKIDQFEDILKNDKDKNHKKYYEEVLRQDPKPITVSGPIMVTKNPCTHPGDIRLLKAVGEDDDRYERLRDYINVIVFPSKGERPE